MTRPDKKNKREYERKLKAQGGGDATKSEKGKGSKKGGDTPKSAAPPPASSAPPPPTTLSKVKGEAESAEKLIEEANQRFLEAEEDNAAAASINAKYAKRNITSNWTKYELPPSDDSEDENVQNMTGADFNYVLSTAQGADSHFRLKSEQEWSGNAEKLGELSQEFFSLDLVALEKSIACIPLHMQIGLSAEELDEATLDRISKKAEDSRKLVKSCQATDKTEDVTKKMMDILTVKSEETASKDGEKDCQPILEEKSKPISDRPISEILEEAKQIVKEAKIALGESYAEQKLLELKAIQEEKKILEQKALEQRTNRRQRGKVPNKAVNDILCLKGSLAAKVPDVKPNAEEIKPNSEEIKPRAGETNPKAELIEAMNFDEAEDTYFEVELQSLSEGVGNILNDDLEFLESLDVEIKSLEKKENSLPHDSHDEEASRKGVVSVKIVKEDTKNLEDWLDDFLDD